ncbi:MAG: glycosyltransferase [Patescibacteria group bacterium]
MLISLIIPTYNEKDNIKPLLSEIQKLGLKDYEIIFVDDSSPDGTGELISAEARKNPAIRLIKRPAKQGLGSAYFQGMSKANGNFIITMEADFLVGLSAIKQIIFELESGVHFVLGSRYIKGGSSNVFWLKRVGSRIINLISGWYLGISIKDPSFALRGIRRDVFKKIKGQITFFGHPDFFIQESFLAYKASGGKVKEIPVTFTSRIHGQSKVAHLFGAGFKCLAALHKIKRSWFDSAVPLN